MPVQVVLAFCDSFDKRFYPSLAANGPRFEPRSSVAGAR
jgi:hypothetical protein